MPEYRQQTLLWVVDPWGRLDWECDREHCTADAGGDHAPACSNVKWHVSTCRWADGSSPDPDPLCTECAKKEKSCSDAS